MPAIGWLIGTAVLAGSTGFWAGGGVDGAGKLVKWGVIGGGVYLGAKHFKLI